MTVKDLLDTYYSQDEVYKAFVSKLPSMYEYAERVFVLNWQEEFAVADKNPEVIDEIEFYNMLLEAGLITQEQYKQHRAKLPTYASRTEGVAFIEANEVSFRSKVPHISVVLHELGHCYFKENDSVWNGKYGGGERLMWLILNGLYEGDERDIRSYMTHFKRIYTQPQELYQDLNRIAKELIDRYRLDVESYEEYKEEYEEMGLKLDDLKKLCMFTGYYPTEEEPSEACQSVLVHALESIRYRDYHILWTDFLKELIETIPF